MRYKNVTERVLKFRAFDEKQVKKVFILKPSEEVELGRESIFSGLELIGKGEEKEKKERKKKGE